MALRAREICFAFDMHSVPDICFAFDMRFAHD